MGVRLLVFASSEFSFENHGSSDPARGAESHLRVIELADRRRYRRQRVLTAEKRNRATLNCLSCLTIALSPVSQSGPFINVRESAYEFEMERNAIS
jgi:hypothetical protein